MTLTEIDNRLDLFKKYLDYRIDFLINHEGYQSSFLYYLKKNGIVMCPAPPNLKTFDEWLKTAYRARILGTQKIQGQEFLVMKNDLGMTFRFMKYDWNK